MLQISSLIKHLLNDFPKIIIPYFHTMVAKSAWAALILQDGILRLSLYLVCLSWTMARVENLSDNNLAR